MRRFLFLGMIIVQAFGATTGAAARPRGEAADRCLTYGFRDQDRLARCTEIELRYPAPKHWTLKEINRASNQCLRLGFGNDDRMAMCDQRQLRPDPR